MRPSIHVLSCLVMVFAIGCAHATQPLTPVASQGETLIAATAGKLNVQVKIKTHEVQIGKPSDGKPTVIQSSCTYSKYPCSIVDRIEITVNGKPLFIRRSVFCSLADLNRAEIKAEERGLILMLYGGDASESYVARIEFDDTRVKRRTILVSGNSGRESAEETVYHTVVLGD